MLTTVLAMLTLATGATVEISVERGVCSRLEYEVRAGTLVELEDFEGVKFRVVSVTCQPIEDATT